MASPRDPSTPSDDRPAGLVSLPDRSPEALAAFAREHRRAAARAFDSLPLPERIRMVGMASPRDRLTLIFLSRDADALALALPAPDFFFTVKEAGDDAPDLVRLASPDQVRICLDLDCWAQDALDVEALTAWLTLLQESEGKLGEVLPALDLEILIAWLKSRIRIWKAEADGSLPPEAPSGLATIDGVYHLESIDEGDSLPLVRTLLIEARGRDEVFYWRLVEGIIHELDHEIETQAFRWRESRLGDEGFPSLDDSLALYARLDPPRWRAGQHRKPEPAPPAPPAGAANALVPRADPGDALLFTRAWEAGLRAGGWAPIQEEMAYLLNRILIADGAHFDAAEGVQPLLRRARATLSLGLESAIDAAGGRGGVYGDADVEESVRWLREIRLDAIFRLGFTRTLEVRDAAMRADSEPEVLASRADGEKEDPWTAILDPPLPGALAAARRRRPLFFEGLADPGSSQIREFRTLREITLARRAMGLALALRALWEELSKQAVPGSLPASVPRRLPMRLSGLAITAFALRVLDGTPALRPIPRGRLRALHETLFEAAGPACARPALRSDARAKFLDAFASWLGSLGPEAREDAVNFLDGCLERLCDEVGVLDPDRADPRAVSAILLAAG